MSTSGLPPLYLNHPSNDSDFANRAAVSFFPLESYTYTIPPPGQPFALDCDDDDDPQAEIHYEVTFISACALRIRFGPIAVYPYKRYFPPDAAFPPLQVRKWLFPYHDEEPPDDEPRGEERDDLKTDWEISEGEHTFKKWVEPRGSGLEFRHAMEDGGGLMGFEAYWKNEKEPFWKESIRGPFSHGTLPTGVGKLGDEVRCFELFALRHGEKLFIGRSTSGLVRTEIVPRDVLTGENTGIGEGAENASRSTRDQSPRGRHFNPLGKTEEDDMASIMGHWNGYYPTPMGPEIFFWTDGGWGCLLRNPAMVAQTLLEGPQGVRGLVSLVCKGDMMDYIIVVGDALEKMKKEYAVEDD
ncbi:hypothetical protein P7C71_g3758, partial [Lecanoromycetidae sp. Uapishka_2]